MKRRNYTIGIKVTAEEKAYIRKLCDRLEIERVSDYVRMLMFMPEKVESKKFRAFWREIRDKYILEEVKKDVLKIKKS